MTQPNYQTLTTFYLAPKNSKWIKKVKCEIVGQGLTNAYNILLCGNGYNQYKFELMEENDSKINSNIPRITTIIIKEEHLLQWIIQSKSEDCHEIDDEVYIDALANKDGTEYFWLQFRQYSDFDFLLLDNKKYKIINITVTNSKFNLNITIPDTITETDLIKTYSDKYKEIDVILNYNNPIVHKEKLQKLKKIPFLEWIQMVDCGAFYYMISDDFFFKFLVTHIIKQNAEKYLITIVFDKQNMQKKETLLFEYCDSFGGEQDVRICLDTTTKDNNLFISHKNQSDILKNVDYDFFDIKKE